MFNVKRKEISTTNEVKDFKKLSILVRKAVGYNTIPEFANNCGIPNLARTIANIIHEKITTYPDVGLLKKIADGSEMRVSFDELRIACGYSLNDNGMDLKSIKVMRGWIVLCDYGNVLDSEQGGIRPSLVLQNNVGNQYAPITMVAPLSTRLGKNNQPTHIRIGQECGLSYESEILIEQMRVVSKRRLLVDGLLQVICECPEDVIRKVEIAILKQTGIVDTRLNESTVDKFLTKIDEYTQRAKAQRIENNRQVSYTPRNREMVYA